MGGRGLFSRVGVAQESMVLDEVVKGTSILSQKQIGGIIVFERAASLEEFIEEGIRIDANVTKELIYSIFVPSYENPIHDGALIIKGYRIQQVRALLPLSQNPKIDKSFGTRHRAAIGITEETDAVSIVISEESGKVSLCFNGKISRGLDPSALRKALFGLFYKKKRARRFWFKSPQKRP
jgi:diadenylate cyclase